MYIHNFFKREWVYVEIVLSVGCVGHIISFLYLNLRSLKMNHPRVGIGVLIFNNKSILLGKRLLKHGSSSWAPPGGHLEFGETFEECAIREVKEETGLEITSPKMIAVTNDIFPDDNKHYVSIFLRTKYDHKQEIQNREPDKILLWDWFDIDQLPDNLFLPLQNLLKNNPILLDESFVL